MLLTKDILYDFKPIYYLHILPEDNIHIINSTSDEDYDHIYTDTESTTKYEAQQSVEKKTSLQDIINRKENNNSRIKYHTRREEFYINDKGKYTNFKTIFSSTKFTLAK